MNQLLFLEYPLIAGVLSAVLCSYLGVFVVLRRNIFIGLALPQISALGIAIGFFFGQNPFLFSIIFILLGVFYFTFSHKNRILPDESIIGFAYVFTSALSILFIANSPKGKDEIINLLFGNILTVDSKELLLLGILTVTILYIFIKFFRKFLIVSYDIDTAKIQKIKVKFWNLLFYLLLGITISITIKIIGSLLVFAFLLIPTMTGLVFIKSIKWLLSFSILFGMIITVIGIILSFYMDLPTGPFIIALAGILFLSIYIILYLNNIIIQKGK